MDEQEIRADVEIAGGAESSHVAWQHCARLLALLDAERAQVSKTAAVVEAATQAADCWGGPRNDVLRAHGSVWCARLHNLRTALSALLDTEGNGHG
jgi:hypothetical protein